MSPISQLSRLPSLTRRDSSSVLPLLVPWLGFVTLTVAMPACDLKPREAAYGEVGLNPSPRVETHRSEARSLERPKRDGLCAGDKHSALRSLGL
jgi:hypothetical protein